MSSPNPYEAPTESRPQPDVQQAARKRFAESTRNWLNRRIALLVDGVVVAAPIVKAEITSRHFELPTPGDTLAKRTANAERIARTLERK